jgi:hypothetical protein
MEKVTKDAISKMSSTLSTRAQKFNGEYTFYYLLILLMHMWTWLNLQYGGAQTRIKVDY